MRIASKRPRIFSVESVAMTDIVMNLFLFFFISFSLIYTFDPNRSRGIDVKLPRAESSDRLAAGMLTVVVSAEDILYIKGKAMTVGRAVTFLQQARPASILIKADKSARVGAVVAVWDACKKAGIDQISIATAYKE